MSKKAEANSVLHFGGGRRRSAEVGVLVEVGGLVDLDEVDVEVGGLVDMDEVEVDAVEVGVLVDVTEAL